MREPSGAHNNQGALLRLMVAVDFTLGSFKACRYARMLAERFGSTIYLLHVLETERFATGETTSAPSQSARQQAHKATEQLNRLAAAELGPGFMVTGLVRWGTPALEILRAAAKWEADLIVLAGKRRSALSRPSRGEIIRQVEQHATCPVLVVGCRDHIGGAPGFLQETGTSDPLLQRGAGL